MLEWSDAASLCMSMRDCLMRGGKGGGDEVFEDFQIIKAWVNIQKASSDLLS